MKINGRTLKVRDPQHLVNNLVAVAPLSQVKTMRTDFRLQRLPKEHLVQERKVATQIRTAAERALGDTLLLWEGSNRLASFAVCHWGPASEAGEGCLFIKFGAVRPGHKAVDRFAALLDAASALARSVGLPNVLAGVNLAREEAYRHMLARGFRSRMQVVTMHRPNEPGYSRPRVFVLDDWR